MTPTPRTEAGRGLVEWFHHGNPLLSMEVRARILAIETEAAGAALAALRAQVEAAFAGPSFGGHEGLNLDGQLWLSGARDFHRAVLAVIDGLSGAAPAAGEE